MSDKHANTPLSPSFDPVISIHLDSGLWTRWSGRLIWVSACLLVSVVSWNGWETYQRQLRIGSVRCDVPVFDFRQAFFGDIIEHTFYVTNVSRQSLQIDKVLTSCGCTTLATELSGKSIGPGQSFEVPVKLTLSRSEKGELERPIIVHFVGEPSLPLTLRMKGHVENRWGWSTERVIFDKIQVNEVATRSIELRLHQAAPPEETPKILTSMTSLLRVDAEPDPTAKSNRSHRFTITTIPPLSWGRHEITLQAIAADGSIGPSTVQVILIVTE